MPGLFAGLCTLDVVHRLDELPGSDEKKTAARQDVAAGGPATNAALTFAALGGTPTLLTGIGGHGLGEVIRRDLDGHGVTVVDLRRSAQAPAISAVRVDSGTGRRSVSSPDATAEPALAVPGDLAGLVGAADVVLLDGHHAALATAAAVVAGSSNTPVVLDAGRWRPVFADLLARAEFVVASADFTVDGAAPTPQALLRDRVLASAVTAGSGPVRWASARGRAAIDVEAVAGGDTLGAGDAFHGAVAFAVAALGAGTAAAHWPRILRFAADVAAVRVAHIGPREWLADERLRKWGAVWTASRPRR